MPLLALVPPLLLRRTVLLVCGDALEEDASPAATADATAPNANTTRTHQVRALKFYSSIRV